MKKIQYLLLALILSAGSLFAETTNAASFEPSPLQSEIQELFSKSPIKKEMTDDVLVRVEVVLNQNNELVVLRTDCDDEQVKAYIQEKLNYQRMGCRIDNKNQKFIVPIRFRKK